MGDYWSEIRGEDSALERERQDADLREHEEQVELDRLRRDDPDYVGGFHPSFDAKPHVQRAVHQRPTSATRKRL